MFDTELFSEAAIRNAEHVIKQIETPIQNDCNLQFSQDTFINTNKNKIYDTNPKDPTRNHVQNAKRKNQPITDTMSKKVKKVCDKTKNSFRKLKYTKAVKNWLEDVNPNNTAEKDDDLGTKYVNESKSSKRAELEVEKASKEKPSKKVVQAQLTNKEGIMKFGKPKSLKTMEEPKGETEQSVTTLEKITEAIITEKSTSCKNNIVENKSVTKERRNKPKCVAPIKSQIPVRDVEFKVTIIDELTTDPTSLLRSIENKAVVVVLMYRNGFCQLNNQHTEDTCEVEGIMISIEDEYFYYKGCFENNREAMRSFLENNKIMCYEGKSLLLYIKYALDLDGHNIEMIDAKIGGCLLDPDHPPENFSELQKLTSFTPQFTIATECVLQKTAWYVSLLKECSSKLQHLLQEEQLWNVFVDIEMKLLPIIADMERLGVAVDLEKLKCMEDILVARMKSTELACHRAAGRSFQVNSPVQVRAILYDELRLDAKCNVKITETLAQGAKSTSEAMLKGLVSVHPLPRLVLEYRHLHKAHATFLAGIAQHVKDGVVRPTWVQMAASTGRIASNNPNLQAIPKAPFSLVLYPENNASDAAEALGMRSVYVARAGCVLLAADFQHVECRVFAHAAADGRLHAALRAHGDLFRCLAAEWLEKPAAAVSGADRERTKRIVYASLYGAGARKLMDILAVPYDQALAVMASFNRTFPALKSFGREVVSACARGGGRVATLCGRTRRLPHIASAEPAARAHAERQAVNFVVQGSAADLCKLAMVAATAALRAHRPPLHARLLLQIHDELVWEVRRDCLPAAAGVIKVAMEACGRRAGLRALPVALSAGEHWGDMRDYCAPPAPEP